MPKRLFAALLACALIGAAPAPAPTATPLKTISHVRVSALCTGLRRNIGPAIGKVLQNDKVIATSRPLFRSYVKDVANTTGSRAAQDLDVARLERLISPLVQNNEQIEKLLNDSYIFPKVARSDADQQLLSMRAHLQAVLQQQKGALNVISGFVDTAQLGELQAAGHEYDAALGTDLAKKGTQSAQAAGLAPTPPPADVLNAGVSNPNNDPARANDPRYLGTGNVLGYNPLDVFGNAVADYQAQIDPIESATAKLVMRAVPLCSGPAPQASPSPKP